MFAKIIVDVPSANTDDLYTYKIPDSLLDCIYIGSRVYVEFGFRKLLGYVIEITDDADYSGSLKDIIEVIDFEQGLNQEQIELAKVISKETKSYLTSCLDLMYPSFLKSKVQKYINVLNYDKIDAELALLFKLKKKILITNEILSKYKKISKELDKGNIEITSKIFTYGKNKVIKYYKILNFDFDVKTQKQMDVLMFVKNNGEATSEEIKANSGCSDFIIDKLVELKYLQYTERPLMHEPKSTPHHTLPTFDFNKQQIVDKYHRLHNKPFLLHSNDDKFKLDFYLSLSIQCVKLKKQVLIVTPSILSNYLIYNYFNKKTTGYRLFNFSSKLSNSDYYYNYTNVLSQNVDIVICTRSGIFLPLENIGLIIMVDEDNLSYINEQNPKYNTLEVLKHRMLKHQSKLVLSSTSPSIISYNNYYTAKYFLLQHIVENSSEITLINMKEELEDLMLSHKLKLEVLKNIETKQISMLILNTLGYNPTILCEDCGSMIKCEKCKIGLVYHKEKSVYKCSYCNLQVEEVECERCGSHEIKNLGFGLEKLKERLLELYPQSRIIQVDSETMLQKNAYENFLVKLEENDVDIIIGTNILINNLGSNIKLIGMINADSILNLNDYRSSEIVFHTMSKVIGNQNCKIVIQGYNLDHYAIKDAVNNNYESFYNHEIENRKNFEYPPFNEVNRLVIAGDYKDIYFYANYFKKVFSRIIGGSCLGPVYLPKLRGVQLVIKHSDFEKLSTIIDEVNKKFNDKKLTVSYERFPKSFY